MLLAQQGKTRLQEQLCAYNREVKRLDSLANYEYFSQLKPIELEGGRTFVFAQKEKELFHEKLFEVMEQRDQAATQLAQNIHTINFQSDMVLMARDIAKQIEAELEYPGQIKVNVIRESRVTDYAK